MRSDNRWGKLAKFIPLETFGPDFCENLSSSGLGPPAKSVRVALGTLIIKEKLGMSDEEIVERIRENPYLMYFRRSKDYKDDKPFDLSMFFLFS